ncbi:MAG: hypothetical protein ACPG05_03070 [Bdellovibrionales bacterium]
MRDFPIVMVSFRCFEDMQTESGLYVPVLKTSISGKMSGFAGNMEADPFRASHSLVDSLVDGCRMSPKCASFILGEEKEPEQESNVTPLFPVFTANVLTATSEEMVNAGIGIQCYTASAYTMKRFSEKLALVSGFKKKDSPLHDKVCTFVKSFSEDISGYCTPIIKERDVVNRRASMRIVTP